MSYLAFVAAFAFGLLIGSFLNVCIHRMPRDESVVSPRSRCVQCGHPIRWYDNIPVVSFVWLGGRCRDCRAALSFLYPVVELLTGLMFVLLVMRFGVGLLTLKYAVFISMMVVLGFADLIHRLLPNQITLGGAAAGVAFSLIEPLTPGIVSFFLAMWGAKPDPLLASVVESVVGATVAAGILYLVAEIYFRLRFREGMGLGDVKMMALIGAFLGLGPAFWVVMLASVLGAVLGLIFILLFRKGMMYELPFGTFLALAAILLVVWRHEAA